MRRHGGRGWCGVGGPCVALQTCPAPPTPGERRTVQLSPRVAFLWVAGKAWAVGGAQPLCAGLAGRRVWPPNPPTPPGPPPRGSAGVYRKCRTRLGGGWRGPGRCVLARLVGLRAGLLSAHQGRGFLLLLKGKVPLPGQPCPSPASFLQDATPCRPPKPPPPPPPQPPLPAHPSSPGRLLGAREKRALSWAAAASAASPALGLGLPTC